MNRTQIGVELGAVWTINIVQHAQIARSHKIIQSQGQTMPLF